MLRLLALSLPMIAATRLTPEIAARLAALPLQCIHQEYPNKTGHTIEGEADARLTPKQLHPAFYGCFDWHSSVHGHWMLVHLLRAYPAMANAAAVREILRSSLTADKLLAESQYFQRSKLAATFERTYGWAWLLKLDQELLEWDDPQAREWRQNLHPLRKTILSSWMAFLPKQTYPNRTGVHPNTAFGLVFALDWARAAKSPDFEAMIVQRAKDYYLTNRAVTAMQEPDGTDFLSPTLEVADLMRRVLPQAAFAGWFQRYVSAAGLANVSKLPVVSDRTDYQIVHLDGLSLSRAWCLRGIASALPAASARRKPMEASAAGLLAKALPHVTGGNYGGEHWLASFAVYALAQGE